MAWQTPKTNWAAADVIGSADMNRIEGDLAQLRSNTGNADPTSNTVLLGTGAGTSSWGQIADAYVASNASIAQSKISNASRAIDADCLDGYHAGNASGQVPVSNSTVCTNLNADQLDGQHGSYYDQNAHVAATSAVHGLGSGVYLVGCKQGSGRRIETKSGSVTTTGGSAWYSITTTWNNAFSGTPEVAICLGSGRNQAAAVALGQVSISTTSCTVQFQYTGGQTTDVFTLHAIAVGT